jgi:hypothetical protein
MTAAAPKSTFHSDQLRNASAARTTTPKDGGSSPASTPVKNDGIKASATLSVEDAAARPASAYFTSSEAVTTFHPIPQVRNHIFHLSVLVGQLAAIILNQFPFDDGSRAIGLEASSSTGFSEKDNRDLQSPDGTTSVTFQRVTSDLWSTLVGIASLLSLHLPRSILQKIELNRRKYPVELCRVRSRSHQRGGTIVFADGIAARLHLTVLSPFFARVLLLAREGQGWEVH